MITVKELKKLLSTMDENRVVILAKDTEGNNFSPLHKLRDDMNYKATTSWYGETGIEKVTPQLAKLGYTEEDVLEGEAALILWPVD